MKHRMRGFAGVILILSIFGGLPLYAQQDTIKSGRFVRGSGTNAEGHSFVVGLDFQRGRVCGDNGGASDTLFPYLPGSSNRYHYNQAVSSSLTNIGTRISFRNPIASFGTRVGGSPLYVGQRYRFGAYAGEFISTPQVVISCWTRSGTNFTYVGPQYVDIPDSFFTPPEWLSFKTNGYSLTVSSNGLTTTIALQDGDETQGTESQWGVFRRGTVLLTHTADSSATNKVYQVGIVAYINNWPTVPDFYAMVAVGSGGITDSPLYTLDFEARPPSRTIFVDQTQFEGEPIPSAYAGKTPEQLLTNNPVLTTFSLPLGATTYTNLDHSPELRRHPTLDQFVKDMRQDPIALTRYVHNSIEMSDALGFNENGLVTEVSLNQGGVARGALATFLEGRGAPAEQCALLVYLLRQAGVPAVYVYPYHNQMMLLDKQCNSLLRMQVTKAVNNMSAAYTTNRALPVNYPWVAAYVNNSWVHLFPWLKDTEVIEGLNLYDYMPSAYDNGFKWAKNYLYGDTNILASVTDDDTVLGIYERFIQKELNKSAPGLSVDDMGYSWRSRKNSYHRWKDFPHPWVTPSSAVAVDTLSSPELTNASPRLTKIFDTMTVEVSSVSNPAKKVSSGEVRLVDLHNRRMIVRHEKTGANAHNLILSLSEFRAGASGTTNFTIGDSLLRAQQVSTPLNSSDDALNVKLTYKRHRGWWEGIVGTFPDPNTTFPSLIESAYSISDYPMRKGDLASVCLNYGVVSRAMLNVHANNMWAMQRLLTGNPSATNSLSPELYQGGYAVMAGLSFYERVSRLREVLTRLHKASGFSYFDGSLVVLAAKHVSGALPNSGDIILTKPMIDVRLHRMVIAGNWTTHPDSGLDLNSGSGDWLALHLAGSSSEEHRAMNAFFGQTDSVSTVRLLQLAQKRSSVSVPGILPMDAANYQTFGNTSYNGVLLKNHDSAIWASVTNFFEDPYRRDFRVGFVTPGVITNTGNTYLGMGALLWTPGGDLSALISPGINGGYSPPLPETTFDLLKAGQTSIGVAPGGDFYMDYTQPGASSKEQAPQTVTDFATGAVVNNATAGYYSTTATQDEAAIATLNAYGLSGSGTTSAQYGQALQTVEDRGLLSTFLSTADKVWSTVADPVDVVTGEFWVSEVDLSLPGPMPLELKRNYSSLNMANNQFGYGWKFNFMPYLGLGTNETTIYAAEADGSVLAYSFLSNNTWVVKSEKNPLLDNRSVSGIGSKANDFKSQITRAVNGGVSVYTLTKPDGSIRKYQTGLIPGDTSLKPYLTRWQDDRGNFFGFEYGTNSALPDYKEVRRVQSSNGNFLGLVYDIFGRVIEAATGDGRTTSYVYDEHGDLTSVTLPDGSERAFEYERKTQSITNGSVVTQIPYSSHLLTKEIKPDSRILVNQYDAYRRVTNQLSTVSNNLALVRNASFTYSGSQSLPSALTNSPSGSTIIVDVNGKNTLYRYTNGLITLISNAVGGTLTQDWYLTNESSVVGYYPRSLQRLIDKRGLITDYKYDANGNVTNIVVTGNLTGGSSTNETATTTMSYTNNLLWEVIDPVGNRTRYVYDTNYPYQAHQVIRLSGTSPISTNVIFRQNVTNIFSVAGQTLTNIAFGVLKQELRAFGTSDSATSEWAYDGRGFPLLSTRYTGTPDSNVVVSLVHNNRGQLVERVDSANRTNRFDYDGMGRLKTSEVISETGVPMSWDYHYYNDNGEPTWSDGPRFNPEDYSWRDYDAAGRVITEIRWRSRAKTDGSGVEAMPGYALWASTFREYDTFGNLKRTIDPRGVIVTNSWDAIGRLVQKIVRETNGTILSAEQFVYDLADSVRFNTNALGGVTETQYTSTGNTRFHRGPDGATHSWTYYLDGRLKRETLRNGSYWETSYDDLNRKETKIFYNAANAALATNRLTFDRRGNVVTKVDAGGNTWTNLFDGLDRIKLATGPVMTNSYPTNAQPPSLPGYTPVPVQLRTTNYYDAAGVVVIAANAFGEKTLTYNDALSRPTRTEIRSSSNTLIRETTYSYLANHHGVTVTDGSGANAIVNEAFTDNDGNVVLKIAHPAANVLEIGRSDFDVVGNTLIAARSSSSNGTVVTFASVTNTFDGLGRLVKKVDRDNAVTTYAYNALGNLTNRTMPGATLTWGASYNPAGQLLLEINAGSGGVTARRTTYGYYPTNSSFAGLPQYTTNALGVVCLTSYDAWLHENAKTYSHSNSVAQYSMTTSFSYDARELLTNISESFGSGLTGPSTTLLSEYDAYGSRTREDVFVGTTRVSGASESWDSGLRRKGLSFGQFGIGFTWRADGLLESANGVTGGGTYGYNTAGLLTSRSIGQRTTTYTQRDGAGRILGATTAVGGQASLTETLTWTGDGLLASHQLTRSDYTDQRTYAYANQSRRLTNERLAVAANTFWTNAFTFDSGQASGMGVLTRAGAVASGGVAWNGTLDALSRVSVETNSVSRRPAYGGVKGKGQVVINLDGRPMPVSLVGTSSPQWRSSLDLTPGAHQLIASAIHSSGKFVASKTNTFTNNATENVAVLYNAAGQITNRLWKNGSVTNRSQALVWDGRGRLLKVSERDSQKSGFDWSAVYDGLGRRLQTTTLTTIVTNNVTNVSSARIVKQYYDPEHRFLEVGVTEGGRTTWKLLGPDVNGVYGGMQGTGGFDAFVPTLELFCPLVPDVQGNIHGIYVTHSTLTWYPTRVTGYGAVPSYRPPPLSHGGDLAGASVWRGRWSDVTGLTYLGHRYYDPVEGRFLSGDPMGHEGSGDLYSFCAGDPINYFDPDGRFGKGLYSGAMSGGSPSGSSSAFDAAYMLGGVVGGYYEGLGSGIYNEVSGVGKLGYGMTVGFGEQITLTGMDTYSAYSGGGNFQSAIFNGTYNMALNGATTGDIASEAALHASGYRFGNAIYDSIEYGSASGDFSQFSQNMGIVAGIAMGPKASQLAAEVEISWGGQSGVRPYEVGRFGELRDRSLVGDGLDLDHQPSHASNVARAEAELGRPLTPAEIRRIRDQGTAVAVPEQWHRTQSRTYGGRNTAERIQSDAADPVGAAALDSAAMVEGAAHRQQSAAAAAARAVQRRAEGGN